MIQASTPPKKRRKASRNAGGTFTSVALLAALAGGLALAGCASGIDRAENTCAAHRASMAAFASCLRLNHAMLSSGQPSERDLASRYLAEANHHDGRVRAGKATDEEAMHELARFRTELAAKVQERYDGGFRQADAALTQAAQMMQGQQAQGQDGQIRDSQIVRSPQAGPYGSAPLPGPLRFGPPPLGGRLGYAPPPSGFEHPGGSRAGHYHPQLPATRRPLHPARVFLRAADIPPAGVGAYGVLALRAKATPSTQTRLKAACAAFLASLPTQESLPQSVPVQDRMLTIWPLATAGTPEAKPDDCDYLLQNYDLHGGISAIQDADRQGSELRGQGPYLIGWSPARSRGARDAVVLVLDLSPFDSQQSFNEMFLLWQRRIVEDPTLWRTGFSAERLRLVVRDFVDRYGQAIVDGLKLVRTGN